MVIRLRDFGSRLRLVTRLGPPNLLPGVISSGLQTQDPLPYTPRIYPAGAPAGFTAAYPALRFWLTTPRFWLSTPAGYPAPTSQLITRRPLEWSANTRPSHLIPQAFTRLVHPLGFTAAYPAPRFWLSTPANYPAPTSQLVTQRPLEWSANARPITLYPEHLPGWCVRWGSRRLTRLQTFGSRLPTGYPAPTSQPAKRNALNHARELTRLAHPAPDGMSRGSLSLGLPIGGCRAAATYSAGGPVGPTP